MVPWASGNCTPRESLAGAVGPYGTLGFTYDGVGNRITHSSAAGVDLYAYPPGSNRLSSITLAAEGNRAFTYDAAGNVPFDDRTGGSYGYTYNAAGRMSEFRINGFLQASYQYDALGRQAIRTLTSPTPVTIHSVFDSDGRRIAEYDEASGDLLREYIWNGWDPVALIEGGTIYYVRTDHIGRPIFATNASGAKVWTASYSPFGSVQTSTGNLPTPRFPGQWFQTESGLHQNWMRDYDPTTGRYLEPDPLGLVDGANVYGYVKQNPGRWIDPRGEEGGPVIPTEVPDNIPGGPYSPKPDGRPGSFLGPKQPKGPRIECQYVPEGGNKPKPYWKVTQPDGTDQRYDLDGNPISADEAHPGNPEVEEPCDCEIYFPRWLVPRLPLLFFDPGILDSPFPSPFPRQRA